MSLAGLTDKHPDELLLAAYLDGAVPDDALDAIERHFAGCERCRSTIAALRSVPQEERVPDAMLAAARAIPAGKRFPRWAASAAAIVIVGLLVAGYAMRRDTTQVAEHYRAAAGDELRALSPAPGERVTASPIVFRWTESAAADRYVVTVVDENGAVVATLVAHPPDTSASLSETAPRETPATLLWRVAAMRADRTIAETRPIAFVAR